MYSKEVNTCTRDGTIQRGFKEVVDAWMKKDRADWQVQLKNQVSVSRREASSTLRDKRDSLPQPPAVVLILLFRAETDHLTNLKAK